MRFFKYLVFILLSIISINSYAELFYFSGGSKYSSAQALCDSVQIYNGSQPSRSSYTYIEGQTVGTCTFYWDHGGVMGSRQFNVEKQACTAGATTFLDGYITSVSGFPPTSVCHSGCTYSNDSGGTAFDTPNGNLSWGFDATNTGSTCSSDTPKGEDKPNGDGTGGDGGDGGGGDTGGGGSDGGCTETGSTANCNGGSGGGGGAGGAGGGGGGSGGKGGDGGAGGAGGQGGKGGDVTVNMTPVVNAINSMSTSIVNKLTSVATQITGSISQMSAAITDKIGVTNSKLDQVNANLAQQKAAIEANTAAVNNQTSVLSQKIDAAANSVKNSISEMSAAVTDAIGITNGKLDQVKAEIAQQKAAIEANTAAVNAQGKATQDAINAQGKATQDAINANGDKVKGAVDANTDAVKANGEKIDETNSILDDIKEWLTEKPDTSGLQADIPTKELTPQSFRTNIFSSSAQCPPDVTISLPSFAGRGFSKTFSFADWCYYLAFFGNIILIASYLFGAYIIVSKS